MDNLPNISFGCTTSRILFTVCKMYKIVELKSMKFDSQPNDTDSDIETGTSVTESERAEEKKTHTTHTDCVSDISQCTSQDSVGLMSLTKKTNGKSLFWCHFNVGKCRIIAVKIRGMPIRSTWYSRDSRLGVPKHSITFFHHCKCHVTYSKTADFNPVLAFLNSHFFHFPPRQTILNVYFGNFHHAFFIMDNLFFP